MTGLSLFRTSTSKVSSVTTLVALVSNFTYPVTLLPPPPASIPSATTG